jgi:hypothetical protein
MKHSAEPRCGRLSRRCVLQGLHSTLSVAAAAFQFGCSSQFDDLKPTEAATRSDFCVSERPPNPPAVVSNDRHGVDFVVAVKEYDAGEHDRDKTYRFREMGYDLDGACTGQGAGPTCARSAWATADPPEDGPGGRDNGHGELLHRTLRERGTSSTDYVNGQAIIGSATTVIRVRGYNEATLDPQVNVAVFAASMWQLGEDPPIPSAPPLWEGDDEWLAGYPWWVKPYEPDKYGPESLELPMYFDEHAYVTNSFLVAHLDRLAVPPWLELSQVVIKARLVKENGAWSLVDGTLAGRIDVDSLLVGLDLVPDPLNSAQRLCTNAPGYRTAKQNICASADISFEGPGDTTVPCDAVSWGFKFEAKPAKLTGVVTATDERTCPEAVSPSFDSCSIRD